MTIFQDSGKPILVAKSPVVTHSLDSWWEDLTSRFLFSFFGTCLHRKSTSPLPSSLSHTLSLGDKDQTRRAHVFHVCLWPVVLRWIVNGVSLTPLLSLGSRTIHLHHHCQSLGAREAVDGKQERNKPSRLAELAHRSRTKTEGINTAFDQRGI